MLKQNVIDKIDENLKHAPFEEISKIWEEIFPEEEISSEDQSKDHKIEILGIMIEELEFVSRDKLAYVYESVMEESLHEEEIYEEESSLGDDGGIEE